MIKNNSKKFISKRYWNTQSTAMSKSDVMAKSFDDVINLSLGDPDLITDINVIEAAFNDAKMGHTKYTEFRGDPELRKAIIDFYKEDYKMDLADEEIFVCASACLGMYLALEAILNDGDEVILQGPYFTPYPYQVKLARGIPVELPAYEEEGFQIDVKRLESLITDKTKAIILNSPNNPTGCCITVDVMKKIADIAQKYDLLIIADDIYTAFSYENEFVPFVSLEGMRERTITINSFSKNFTMTGWRIGNIIAPKDIINTIQYINENVVFTAPSVSQRAAIYALRHRREIQPAIVEEYRRRVFYAAERIRQIPKLSVVYPPKGTFYLFVNIKNTGMTSEEASDYFLEKAHILTLPGNIFGECGEGYLRIACTVNMGVLKQALDRMENVLCCG